MKDIIWLFNHNFVQRIYLVLFSFPVDASYDPWANWGACTEECGGGSRSRDRTCTDQQHGGSPCSDLSGALTETESCNDQHCPSKNGLR